VASPAGRSSTPPHHPDHSPVPEPGAGELVFTPAPGLRRLRIDLAYDGAPFSGFAVQAGRDTVQGRVEAALAKLARGPVTTVGAGRTDAGVHARGQVMHADVPDRLDPARVRDSLNAVCGPAITVTSVTWAPPGFHARFSARRRRYVYRVDDRGAPDPLTRGHVLRWKRPLDVDRMRSAAAPLVGEHDFASFCRAPSTGRDGATTTRRLRSVEVRRAGDLVEVEVVADAFCHQMVRSIVGFLLTVGDGRRDPGTAAEVLAARDRAAVTEVAPPHGLVLESVEYADGDFDWPRDPNG
jgi:tRNA pseudouridine38-40 synthase